MWLHWNVGASSYLLGITVSLRVPLGLLFLGIDYHAAFHFSQCHWIKFSFICSSPCTYAEPPLFNYICLLYPVSTSPAKNERLELGLELPLGILLASLAIMGSS